MYNDDDYDDYCDDDKTHRFYKSMTTRGCAPGSGDSLLRQMWRYHDDGNAWTV